MPHINIAISPELLKDMQVACAVAGVSQKEFVLAAIRLHCLTETGQLGRMQTVLVDEEVPVNSFVPEHDVKACRVYRCAQCIALGKKF
jgi:hypothetical protein